MLTRWLALDERIAAFDVEFAVEAKRDEAARRLTSIPGVGALNATALVAAVSDAETFARGRNLAAWLALVPRQATTGGKPRLFGITKRGSKYLRKMLIQGARAALPTLSRSNDPGSIDVEVSLQIHDRTISVGPELLVVMRGVRDCFAAENHGVYARDQHLLVVGSVELTPDMTCLIAPSFPAASIA